MKYSKAAVIIHAFFVRVNNVFASSFHNDVVRRSNNTRRRVSKRKDLQNAILSRVVPLEGHPQEIALRASLGEEGKTAPVPAFLTRQLEDGGDDAYEYDFEIAEYSLKFSRCQTIKSYSDNAAATEGQEDVLVAQNFVVFRLCPSDTCSYKYKFGCRSNYGQYIMLLADYLGIMNAYLENQNEAYCEYCAECFNNDRKVRRRLDEDAEEDENGNDDAYENEEENDDAYENEEENDDGNENEEENDDGGENDDAYANDDEEGNDDGENQGDDDNAEEDEEDDNNGDDAYAEEDEDEDAEDEEDDAGDDNYNFCSGACNNYDDYYSKCEYEEGNYAVDYADWFECTQMEDNNGDNYYIMAHCASESDSSVDIAIGIFSDAYCTVSLGGTELAASYSGYNFNTAGMQDYYPEDCVTCNATALNSMYEDDDGDNDGINDLCTNIYQYSGQCNNMMQDGDNYNNNDGDSCIFIENVLSGKYDDVGEIYLDNSEYLNQDKYYIGKEAVVTSGQKAVLAMFIILTGIFAVWSANLHRMILTKVPWKPRRKNHDDLLDGSEDYSRSGSYEGAMA